MSEDTEGVMSRDYELGYERGKADAYHELGEKWLPEGYVCIHARLWEDTKLDLQRATLKRDILQARWDSAPWRALRDSVMYLMRFTLGGKTLSSVLELSEWCDANAPDPEQDAPK